MEIWFQIENGWYQRPISQGFEDQLVPFRHDIDVLHNNDWRRAALCSVYSATSPESQAIADHSMCVFNIEHQGPVYLSWRQIADTSRPHVTKPLPLITIGKNTWDTIIDQDPLDWGTRGVFGDWLEEAGIDWLATSQRWQIVNQKTPGPACVREAAWHEATWFSTIKAESNWGFQNGGAIIKSEWCLPENIFAKLTGYSLDRRDCGHHNRYAKSWNSRREAEIALALVISQPVETTNPTS
jgi:hypothetical protein